MQTLTALFLKISSFHLAANDVFIWSNQYESFQQPSFCVLKTQYSTKCNQTAALLIWVRDAQYWQWSFSLTSRMTLSWQPREKEYLIVSNITNYICNKMRCVTYHTAHHSSQVFIWWNGVNLRYYSGLLGAADQHHLNIVILTNGPTLHHQCQLIWRMLCLYKSFLLAASV